MADIDKVIADSLKTSGNIRGPVEIVDPKAILKNK